MRTLHKGDQLTLDRPLRQCEVELTVPDRSELQPVLIAFVGNSNSGADFRRAYDFNVESTVRKNRTRYAITPNKSPLTMPWINRFLFGVCETADLKGGKKRYSPKEMPFLPIDFLVKAPKLRVHGSILIGELPSKVLELDKNGTGGLWRLAVGQHSRIDNQLISGMLGLSM